MKRKRKQEAQEEKNASATIIKQLAAIKAALDNAEREATEA